MRARLLVVPAVLALVLTGCGQSATAHYCSALQAHQGIFADDGTGLVLITNLPELKVLASDAPDDVRADWQTFIGALQSLHDTIAAAHLRPRDFVNGRAPAGTPAGTEASIAAAANELSAPDVVNAANGIEQEAKDVCQFQIGL
ncbi:MAG: hypothetical protein JWQ32_2788 [Marmoricola sp.]|nr:hypothetical protein [Marmoricola sp.]